MARHRGSTSTTSTSWCSRTSRRCPPSASRRWPTGCAPAAASWSPPATGSTRPRTTRRCCRSCPRACAIRSTPPGARARRTSDSRALHLVKWEADHPIFAPFAKDAPELADAKFFKISLLGPTTATADRKVLARFTNGAAALVEASIGAGRTLLFTSTLDRDWNDLPIHRGFLPLIQQAVRHLARKHSLGLEADHLVGSSVALPTGDLKKLEVRGPDGTGAVFEGDRITGRSSVRYGRTDHPGIYRVIGTDQTGATHDRDELAFAINLDPRGSDLTAAPAAALPTSGTGSATAPADSPRRVELWHALAAIVLLLLLAEGILVQR